MDPTQWDTSTATETNSVRERPKSAVEKAGAWKPAKTKSRFPPAPTLPWKSRPNREIPTFPPRRLRFLFFLGEKQRPKPKLPKRRPSGRIALCRKADRSLIIKTGQLDLLTTAYPVFSFREQLTTGFGKFVNRNLRTLQRRGEPPTRELRRLP